MTSDQSEFVTPAEASRITGLGISTLAKRRMKKLPPAWCQPLPNAIRYQRASLVAWMLSTKVDTAPE